MSSTLNIYKFLFLLIFFSQEIFTLKILIISPLLGHSHSKFTDSVGKVLLDEGHNVTMFAPTIDRAVKYSFDGRMTVIPFETEEIDYSVFESIEVKTEKLYLNSKRDIGDFMKLSNALFLTCKGIVENQSLMDRLRSEQFDVSMGEMYDFCPFGLMYSLGIKKQMVINAFPIFEIPENVFGIDSNPSWNPELYSSFCDKMTIGDRLINWYMRYRFNRVYDEVEKNETEIFKKVYGKEFPRLYDIMKNHITFGLFNSFEEIVLTKLSPPNVKFIGGIAIDEPKPLDRKFVPYVENGKFVVVSFGTAAGQVPQKIVEMFFNVFSRFPDVHFIMKLDNIKVTQPKNVHINKWLPQNDLLAHNNCIAFISHGGQNSVLEAVKYGRPMLFFPLFSDQLHNGCGATKHGFAEMLRRNEWDENTLFQKLNKILTENSYTVAAKRLSSMMHDRINDPRETILKTTVYTAKYGPIPAHNVHKINLSTIQLYMIDAFGLLIGFTLLFVSIVLFGMVTVYRKCLRTKLKEKTN